jgi:4-amino-4-deoxy-L-arabinose transferase-like glycosyltransferase
MDIAEALYWGRELPIGTYKHPPLPAVLANAVYELTNNHLWSLYILAQLALIATAALVWTLARAMLPARDAALAAISLITVYLISYLSPEFNNNVALEPFWIAAILSLHRALRPGAPRPILWWLAAGAAFALAAWCKYSIIFLAAPAAVLILATREGRAALKTPGPYAGALLGAAIIFPHLRWLIDNHFVSLEYARSRPVRGGLLGAFQDPLVFLASIIAAAAPAALCLLPILERPLTTAPRDPTPALDETNQPHPTPFDRLFIRIMVFGPILAQVLAASILNVRLRAPWAAVLLVPLPLALLVRLRTRREGTRSAIAACIAVNLALAASLAVYSLQTPRWPSPRPRTAFPFDQLAAAIDQRWRAISPAPVPAVIGHSWLSSESALFLPGRPRVSNGYEHVSTARPYDPRVDPWLTPDTLRENGAVILWFISPDGPAPSNTLNTALGQLFPTARELAPIDLTYPASDPPSPIRIGIALIPPAPQGR